jgi:hypothetical protein
MKAGLALPPVFFAGVFVAVLPEVFFPGCASFLGTSFATIFFDVLALCLFKLTLFP